MKYSLLSKLNNFTENKLVALSKQRALFRAHINKAQNLLNIAPPGSKQGVFGVLSHTENTVKNERLVM